MIERIAIAGGPGTGKTTLARQLANDLSVLHNKNVFYVSEFARDYISAMSVAMDEPYTPQMSDQLLFIDEQKNREEEAPDLTDFIITDSPLFIQAVYAWRVHDNAFYRDLQQYLHIYKKIITNGVEHSYDFIFVLPEIKGNLNDGCRVQDVDASNAITKQIIGFLQFHDIPFVSLEDVGKTPAELSQTICGIIFD